VLTVSGEGPAAGDWKLSGVPAFEPADGRFAGYRGVAIRSTETDEEEVVPQEEEPLDEDALRELIHELRTPLTAIIGFAEIIDGQYLGPAEQSYRDRAAEIVSQAAEAVERKYPSLVGGIGVYSACCGHGPFTHVDVRGYRARWRGSGNG
jgi:signal transduction histidine kinase